MRLSGGDREDVPEKRSVRSWPCRVSPFEASSILVGIETGVPKQLRDEPGGSPCYWPGGVRRRGGVSSVCGSCTEHEKASADTAAGSTGPVVPPAGRGRVPRQSPKALSTDAVFVGGPARNSCEAAAFWGGGGAKGPAHQLMLSRSTRAVGLGGREGAWQGRKAKRSISLNSRFGRRTRR